MSAAPFQFGGLDLDAERGQQAQPQAGTSDADPLGGMYRQGFHNSP